MWMSTDFRRLVSAGLMVVLLPTLTGCHHQVGRSVSDLARRSGRHVTVRSVAPMNAQVDVAGDGRRVIISVLAAEGVLVAATPDSIQLRDAILSHADRGRSRAYVAVTLPVSREVSVTERKFAFGRTAGLVVVSTAGAWLLLYTSLVVYCGINRNAGGC
jgi:hypothetical protein